MCPFLHKLHASFFFSIKGQPVSKVSQHPCLKPTRIHNTRANKRKQMDKIEKEVHELHKEVTTLRGELEELNLLVVSLVAAHSQSHFQERLQQQYPGYQYFAVVCTPPTLFKIWVISPSFNNISNNLDNRLSNSPSRRIVFRGCHSLIQSL